MKTVLVQGAFEIVHSGHVRVFKFAKSQGDYLIVALNSNSLIPAYKHRRPVLSWEEKAKIVRAFRYVDKVVKATEFSPMKLLRKFKPDVYVIGSEWVSTKSREMLYMKSIGGKSVVCPYFKNITPTRVIKKRLLAEALRGC